MIVPILVLAAMTASLGFLNRGHRSIASRDFDLATLPFEDRMMAYQILDDGTRDERRAMRDRLRSLGYDDASRHF